MYDIILHHMLAGLMSAYRFLFLQNKTSFTLEEDVGTRQVGHWCVNCEHEHA